MKQATITLVVGLVSSHPGTPWTQASGTWLLPRPELQASTAAQHGRLFSPPNFWLLEGTSRNTWQKSDQIMDTLAAKLQLLIRQALPHQYLLVLEP